jgi:uncharacterized iron-regulated membrane protein
MRRALVLGLSVLLLVSSLIIITTTVVIGATGSQTWYLDSDSHSPVSSVLVMYRDGNGTPSDNVSISSGNSKIWFSDEVAPEGGVTFASSSHGNPWTVYLKTTDWDESCFAEVGEGDSLGVFDAFNSQNLIHYGYSDEGILEILLTTGQQTIHQGKYLTLRVTNNSGIERTIKTTGSSWLESPNTDPGYPLTELVSGILLAAGLSGLVVYIKIRRRGSINNNQ